MLVDVVRFGIVNRSFAMSFAILAFLAFYVLLRLGSRIARLPGEVRATRRRRNLDRARNRQDAATVALLEGRYGKARQFAEEALAIPHSGGLPALVGARAAIDMREFGEAEALLARADVAAHDIERDDRHRGSQDRECRGRNDMAPRVRRHDGKARAPPSRAERFATTARTLPSPPSRSRACRGRNRRA